MKISFISLIIALPFLTFGQNKIKPTTDFGQGMVTIKIYGFLAKDTLYDDKAKLPDESLFQEFHYSVMGSSIFRTNYGKDHQSIGATDSLGSTKDSNKKINTTMNISMFTPSYLIKYDSSILYYYSYNKEKLEEIIPYSLDTFTYEYFYRHTIQDSIRYKILPLMNKEKRVINNIPCFKGETSMVVCGRKSKLGGVLSAAGIRQIVIFAVSGPRT